MPWPLHSLSLSNKVTAALQHVKEKWKRIFEPPKFQVYDQRQEELMLHNSNLQQEEQKDKSEAQARVCKLCMFLTAGGRFLEDWEVAFAERATLKRNGGVWTPNQFALAVDEIASEVSGCKAPEGLAATIYEYMDTRSSRLVHVDEFFNLCRMGMRLDEKEKADKAMAREREKTSRLLRALFR